MIVYSTIAESKEIIEFENILSDKELVTVINSYIWHIFYTKKTNEKEFELDIKFSFDGVEHQVHSFNDYVRFMKEVFNLKPFSIYCYHDIIRTETVFFQYEENGVEYSGYNNPMGRFCSVKTLADILVDFKDICGFRYKYVSFCTNEGGISCNTISNGEVNKFVENMTPDNIEENENTNWYNPTSIILDAEFDAEENPDLIEILHETVRKYIPEEELIYCEDEWKENPNQLLAGICWLPHSMDEIREFVDELNYINQSVGGIIRYIPDGITWAAIDEFSVAQVIEDEGELFLVGTEL